MKKQLSDLSLEILEILSHELVSLKSRHPEKTVNEIFTHGASSFNWYEVVINLLTGIYPDNKSISCPQEKEEKIYGGKEWLNPKFKEKKIEDVLVFYFNRLYPEVIWNLYNKGDIKFNNNKIGELFGDLLNINKQDIVSYVEERKGTKQIFNYSDEDISGTCSYLGHTTPDEINKAKIVHEISIFHKTIINYFYGILSKKNNGVFYCNNFNMIPKYCINLLDIVIEKFKDNIIYINTDTIYFRYTKDLNLKKFKQILDISELPYDFENGTETISESFNECFRNKLLNGEKLISNSLYDGIFSPYRKYLLFDKDGKLIKMCGYVTYRDKLEQSALKIKINNYKNYSG